MSRKSTHLGLLAGFGLLLSCTGQCLAHSLHPTYYPLGPFPLLLAWELAAVLFLIPLSILVMTLTLRLWMPRFGFLGNLWRAAMLDIVARIGEFAMLALLMAMPLFHHAGWTSSWLKDFLPLTLCLVSGLALAVPVALVLYRQSGNKASRIILAAATALLAGYLVAMIVISGLVHR